MMKKWIAYTALILCFAAAVSSCNSAKKCGGQKRVNTPMGPM